MIVESQPKFVMWTINKGDVSKQRTNRMSECVASIYGDISSIGRTSDCESEGNGIVTHILPMRGGEMVSHKAHNLKSRVRFSSALLE